MYIFYFIYVIKLYMHDQFHKQIRSLIPRKHASSPRRKLVDVVCLLRHKLTQNYAHRMALKMRKSVFASSAPRRWMTVLRMCVYISVPFTLVNLLMVYPFFYIKPNGILLQLSFWMID